MTAPSFFIQQLPTVTVPSGNIERKRDNFFNVNLGLMLSSSATSAPLTVKGIISWDITPC